MSNPVSDMLAQTANVGASIVTGNFTGAIEQTKKLLAMIEAYVVPPVEPTSLDPKDRAEVDAEVDSEISK